MAAWKWILFIYYFLPINGQILNMMKPKTIRVHKFSTCPGHEKDLLVVKNVQIAFSNRINLISAQVLIRETLHEDIKIKLVLNRCKSREALDSCEKYQNINMNHFCGILNDDNKPWSPFLKMCDPPFACPFKKGVYSFRNGTFDGSAVGHLPVSGWYWIVTAFMVGEKSDRTLGCVNFDGQIVSA
ncbi:uncharacterized protein LOC123010050 [Tribolium madens]|uniref:uncharacterized protein LOC123010050 n=1 Tax=Tribolium madens TaxID=41895 RepID=UPI001CF7529B|nr:uncharacterized protein LOC123010050 [Tribolium madens]